MTEYEKSKRNFEGIINDMKKNPKQQSMTEKEKIARNRILTQDSCGMGASRYLMGQLKDNAMRKQSIVEEIDKT